jgi:histidinol-phosphate aminotransferase
VSRPERRADLRELRGYHSPQLDVQVRLNTNESPFPPPDAFVAAWTAELARTQLHRYPDRAAGALRTAIAARLDQPAARIFPANGSNEVLQTILLTYGGFGRRALVFEPTYALHSHLARITGTEVISAPRGDDFRIDAADAVARIEAEQPDVVFVCSPNNPSGTVEAPETINAIADAARGVVIVDEAYGEFAPESALGLVSEDRGLVVTRTYSKVWSLAALRLGFAVAPAWMVEELDTVGLPYPLDAAPQLAGRLALDHVDAMEARVRTLVEERERLFAALADEPSLDVVPSGANFLLFRCRTGGHAVWQALVDRGVLVRDFSAWPGVEDCLRVTVGTREENDAFLTALIDVLRESGAR